MSEKNEVAAYNDAIVTGHAFNRRWDDIEKMIDYDDQWIMPLSTLENANNFKANGMTALSYKGAWHDPQVIALQPGEVVKAISDTGIKIIIVQTRFRAAIYWIDYVDCALAGKVVSWPYVIQALSDQLNIMSPVRGCIEDWTTLRLCIGSTTTADAKFKRRYRNYGEIIEIQAKMYVDPDFRPSNFDVWVEVLPGGEPLEE